uniref:Uncharacterized protein n=1 Tax=Arundo donax TaxID=35708 RepID=A0A0A9EKJ0_ARUDO
MNQSCTRNGVN